MARQHRGGAHHGLDDVEHWLERYERFWVPIVVVVLLVMIAIALYSIERFYVSHPLPAVPTDWSTQF